MQSRVFLCIVSHGHSTLLERMLPALVGIENLYVVVVDNIGEAPLQASCSLNGAVYLCDESRPHGFGANNNKAFSYVEEKYQARADDYFFCCNPDVLIDESALSSLFTQLALYKPALATINLFNDETYQCHDTSVRYFPRVSDYFVRVLGKKDTVRLDKSSVQEPVFCDWAAGSFLVFSVELFRSLQGFDEKYFMYFEDVDICLRAWRKAGVRLLYLPMIKAVHFGAFRNRRFFSRHFRWYVSSLLRFFFRFYFGGSKPSTRSVTYP